jgi:catechol 2,3-dioxygenase-like lactoylglutathione lyase family enzyme
MNDVPVGPKTYEMPPQEGFVVAHFLTVADIERSANFYEKVFGGRILSRGDGRRAGLYSDRQYLAACECGRRPDARQAIGNAQRAGRYRQDQQLHEHPVADIHACYELWKSRGAEFITKPIPKYGETRCYIRDPDGYIIEVG